MRRWIHTIQVDEPEAAIPMVFDIQREGLRGPRCLLRPVDDFTDADGVTESVLVTVIHDVPLTDPRRCRRLLPEVDPIDRLIDLSLDVTRIESFDDHSRTLEVSVGPFARRPPSRCPGFAVPQLFADDVWGEQPSPTPAVPPGCLRWAAATGRCRGRRPGVLADVGVLGNRYLRVEPVRIEQLGHGRRQLQGRGECGRGRRLTTGHRGGCRAGTSRGPCRGQA